MKALSIGGILDTALRLYKANFLRFFLVGLAAFVPYTLVVSLIVTINGLPPNYGDGFVEPGGPLAQLIYFVVITPLSTGAMVCMVSSTYLERSMSIGRAYSLALQRIGTLLLSNLLYGLAVILGLLLLVVPGILCAVWFMLVSVIVLLEWKSAFRSLLRSRSLMKGNLMKGLVLEFMVLALALIGYVGIGMTLQTVTFSLGLAGVYLDILLESFLEVFFLPFITGATVLLYYDLRVRKEAFDLDQLTVEIGPDLRND